MNALLGIAKVASRYDRRNIVKWCAIKRNKQLNAQWAKENKLPLVMVAIESTDEEWFLGWEQI
jgi:predicted protein tyrosine phosphatase